MLKYIRLQVKFVLISVSVTIKYYLFIFGPI